MLQSLSHLTCFIELIFLTQRSDVSRRNASQTSRFREHWFCCSANYQALKLSSCSSWSISITKSHFKRSLVVILLLLWTRFVAVMNIYMISIDCVLYRRLMHSELLSFARWSLEQYKSIINVDALIYSTQTFFWCFWSIETSITLDIVNWVALIFSIVLIVSETNYLFVERKNYITSVTLVKNNMMFAKT